MGKNTNQKPHIKIRINNMFNRLLCAFRLHKYRLVGYQHCRDISFFDKEAIEMGKGSHHTNLFYMCECCRRAKTITVDGYLNTNLIDASNIAEAKTPTDNKNANYCGVGRPPLGE